jgi:DNA-binding NarL/FixJ family response regulator
MHDIAGAQAGDAQKTIRVFVLDDHEVVRMGLKDLLDAEPDMEVVGEAATAESAVARVPVLGVNVAVLDVRLPDGDGVEVCREIRSVSPGTACLMLTGYADDRALLAAIMAGAAGYAMKDAPGPEVVEAVRAVADGRSGLGPEAAQRVMALLREKSEASDPLSALTSQEKRVLELIGEGLTNRVIAERMFLSEKTVKNYVSSLLAKLGMQRRSQVAALAARIGSRTGDDLGPQPGGPGASFGWLVPGPGSPARKARAWGLALTERVQVRRSRRRRIQVTANPAGPRVLVVDDTDEVRTLIRRALAAHGYQVDDAASLAQANALDPAGYDVVLVDANLGADKGVDLIDALVAQDPAAAGRCLVITGGGTGLVPQGVGVLAKPFRPADLLGAVRALHQPAAARADPVPAITGARPRGMSTLAPPLPPPAAATETALPRSQPATARPGGPASRMPAAWRLLSLIRGLRSSERATLADFVHDGPIQELAAAALALQLTGRGQPADQARYAGQVQQAISTAGRSLRYLTDGDWPFLPPGSALPDTIRQRTAWLPLSSITVDIRQTCAALRAEAPLIVDVVELALFVMTSDGPLSQAEICVQAGENDAEIVLTLTQPGDVRDWAADTGQLPELASILGGTLHTERSPARWQVRITLPRQCAMDDRRH